MKKLVCSILILGSALTASAKGFDSKKCWDNAGSTMEMNMCASGDLTAAKQGLAVATANVVKVLKNVKYSQGAATILLSAITRSDASLDQILEDQCVLEADSVGGTAMAAEIMGCQSVAVKKRTEKLNQMAIDYSQE